MSVFKCKMCGGDIELEQGATVGVCQYCGTKQTLPRLDDDRRANLYDRANHFRRNNEFDKAASIYEQILNEDTSDAEAYWSLVLCRYGIEYVEDPATKKRVPTVNRAQFTSVFDDDNYKSALKYADASQKTIYEEEANKINEIQKGILAISQKEEPFDVFICYKETDSSGRRTPDSVLANDLYHQLTQEGFKVFFARITLEDKLGAAYEPYIFAALNSSKVMVVLGTKPEHFNAVWVKNEWSRYLALVKESGGKKVLIPAYKDMDPYDLPEEFSHLQAQDMGKLGFMQDLIRGIKKLASDDEPKAAVKETVVVNQGGANVAPLLKRAFMFLEDGNFTDADEYCEKVLDQDPENAQAYLGKLMAELHARKKEELKDVKEPFDNSDNYKKAVRFGGEALAAELEGYIKHINDRNENDRKTEIYNSAKAVFESTTSESECKKAAERFKSIPGFKDSSELAEKCLEKAETCRKDYIYSSAKGLMDKNTVAGFTEAAEKLGQIPGYKNADELINTCQKRIEEIKAKQEANRLERERKMEEARIADEKAAKKRKKILSIALPAAAALIVFIILLTSVIIPNGKYNNAVKLMENGEYEAAISAFTALNGYKDAEEKIKEANKKHTEAENAKEYARAEALLKEGKKPEAMEVFLSIKDYLDSKQRVDTIHQEILDEKFQKTSLSAGSYHTVGLRSGGTVVACGRNDNGQCDVSGWKDIVALSAGVAHTVGLRSDGTVVACGHNYYGQCDVSGWKDIVAVSAGGDHTVGLRSDGTVVACGDNDDGQCGVSGWKDIVAVSAGDLHTVGLRSDGTVVACGYKGYGQCDVSGWKDIVAVSAGSGHTVGLRSDGTVVACGLNDYKQCDVSGWKDIVAVSAGRSHTVGLRSDGTVVATEYKGDTKYYYGQCDVSGWTDIVAVSAGDLHTVGLRSDGTVVACGYNVYGQCGVSGWKDILVPQK